MKKPVEDYRDFRLSRINEPRFSHLKLLLGWVFYFSMYFLTENLIPYGRCHVSYCRLDDLIPFCEPFVIFYVSWYLLVFFSLAYFLFYDIPSFKKLQTYIIITQVIAMACYVLYPTIQNLRPEVFPRDNVFTRIIAYLYAFDTPTGVCPSLHVGYSLGILSVFLKYKPAPKWFKILLGLYILGVCLAILFIKQHSFMDFLCALPMCAFAEIVCYGKDYWMPRLQTA